MMNQKEQREMEDRLARVEKGAAPGKREFWVKLFRDQKPGTDAHSDEVAVEPSEEDWETAAREQGWDGEAPLKKVLFVVVPHNDPREVEEGIMDGEDYPDPVPEHNKQAKVAKVTFWRD